VAQCRLVGRDYHSGQSRLCPGKSRLLGTTSVVARTGFPDGDFTVARFMSSNTIALPALDSSGIGVSYTLCAVLTCDPDQTDFLVPQA